MGKYVCTICGYVHTVPQAEWDALPENWVCPMCGAPKALFNADAENAPAAQPGEEKTGGAPAAGNEHPPRQLGFGEMSALFSGLAKACGKQNLPEEMELFNQLAEYYKAKTPKVENAGIDGILAAVLEDIDTAYPTVQAKGEANADRGALRAFTWGSKTSVILKSVAGRLQAGGSGFIKGKKVFVCEICGFIYVGDEKPDICPVCKVPALKIAEIGKGA